MIDATGNILLVGYRGTGKSTLGRLLAEVLGMRFVDMDQVIVDEAGCSISRIVEDHGWPYFRNLEKKILARLSQSTGQVIATGGGVVLDAENRSVLKAMGRVIWLRAAPETIVERLKKDTEGAAQRPAFSDQDLRAETTAILNERTPLYQSVCDVAMDTSAMDVRECVDEIVRIIHIKEENATRNDQNPAWK